MPSSIYRLALAAGTYLDALETSVTEDRLATLPSREESDVKSAYGMSLEDQRVGFAGGMLAITAISYCVPKFGSPLGGSSGRMHACFRKQDNRLMELSVHSARQQS